jgi:hypothetical protein
MRRTALALFVLTASVSALAEDPPRPRSVGTTLLDALPRDADLVVETPDLPALLDAQSKAGLGDAAAWRAAFNAQLLAWGAESASPEKLVRGGGALLDAADGEVLLASIELKLPSTNRPATRATLFAMRTSRDEKALRAVFADLLDGGLRTRYEGEPRQERVDGRTVTTLPGNRGDLFVVIQDGLVVACDHELALGIFLRGLAKDDASAAPAGRPPVGQLKLVARYGRGDAAWEGWAWGDAESVQWKTDKAPAPFRLPSSAVESRAYVVLVGADRFADLPLLPVPIGRPESSRREGVNAVGLMDDGVPLVLDVANMKGASRLSEGGGASRLAWLRAYASGKIESAVPGVDPSLLHGPYESAAKAAGETVDQFVAWKTSSEPGRLTGPLGHGPATFLALRCLHDALRAIAPGGAPETPTSTTRPKTPLPPPTESKDH